VLCLALLFVATACPSHRARIVPLPSARATRPTGGTLVVAYPHEPATLNPFVRGGDDPPTRDLVRPFLPSLYTLGPHGERSRSLLASDPVASAGPPFTITLTLRSDAVWSDGAAITAGDLRFTWQTLVDRRWPIASRDGYDQIGSVDVLSPTQARIVFAHPYARWMDLFDRILPSHVLAGKPFGSALTSSYPVSGGPFLLSSWTPGLQIVYTRNPRAWGQRPLLDRIVVQFVPDVVTAFQLLAAGKVDALGPYPGVDVQRRAGLVPGAHVSADLGSSWDGIVLNTRDPTLSDPRVRQALALAIDRPGIVAGLVRGEGTLLDALEPGGAPAFGGRDLARAEALLDAAGWTGTGTRTRHGSDLSFTLALAGDELPDRVAAAIHQQAAEAGFDVDIVDMPPDELWRDWIWGSRFEAAFLEVRDPPGGALRARYDAGYVRPKGFNISGIADASLDGALRGIDASASGTEAAAERRLAALVPAIPLYQSEVVLVAGPHAGGLVADASEDGFLTTAAAWYRAS
jgi:peptide/nickel transport system substrate-binding protein